MKQTICLVGFALALACVAPSIGRAQCLGDFNRDGMVTVNELIVAVNNALDGCPGSGQRFVDNGDNTISDRQTGLMWEKKENLDGTQDLLNPRDADNQYTWSSTGTAADGTVFTDFLPRLSTCISGDGATVTGGFAGHCDWRLPTIAELQTTLDRTASGCSKGGPCVPSVFLPTQADGYWSATTSSGGPTDAWLVGFDAGGVDVNGKTLGYSVRAVRGGL